MEAKKSSSSNTLTDLVTAIQLACDAAAMALILNGIEKDFTAASLTMSMLPPEKKNGGDKNGDLNLLDACVLTLVSTLETLFLKASR